MSPKRGPRHKGQHFAHVSPSLPVPPSLLCHIFCPILSCRCFLFPLLLLRLSVSLKLEPFLVFQKLQLFLSLWVDFLGKHTFVITTDHVSPPFPPSSTHTSLPASEGPSSGHFLLHACLLSGRFILEGLELLGSLCFLEEGFHESIAFSQGNMTLPGSQRSSPFLELLGWSGRWQVILWGMITISLGFLSIALDSWGQEEGSMDTHSQRFQEGPSVCHSFS